MDIEENESKEAQRERLSNEMNEGFNNQDLELTIDSAL